MKSEKGRKNKSRTTIATKKTSKAKSPFTICQLRITPNYRHFIYIYQLIPTIVLIYPFYKWSSIYQIPIPMFFPLLHTDFKVIYSSPFVLYMEGEKKETTNQTDRQQKLSPRKILSLLN